MDSHFKHVRFDEEFDPLSTPLKSTTLPRPLNMFSPGLSPIHQSIAINDDDYHNLNEKDVEEEEHSIQNVNNSMEESRLSFLELVNESASLNYENEMDSTLKSVSLLHENSISYHYDDDPPENRSNTSKYQENMKEPSFKYVINEQLHETPKVVPNNSIPLSTSSIKSQMSTTFPLLKPGSIFTVVLDNNGSPMFVPVVYPEEYTKNSRNSFYSTNGSQHFPMKSTIEPNTNEFNPNNQQNTQNHINQSFHSPLSTTPTSTSRKLETSFSNHISSNNNNNNLLTNSIKKDSKYWRNRLNSRQNTSVL